MKNSRNDQKSSNKTKILIISFVLLILIIGICFYLFNSTHLNNKNYNASSNENLITMSLNEKIDLKSDLLYKADSYEIDNSDIIKIDENGNLIGLKSGIANIKKIENGNVTGTIKVIVDPKNTNIARIESEDLNITLTEDEKVYEATIKDTNKDDYTFTIYTEDENALVGGYSDQIKTNEDSTIGLADAASLQQGKVFFSGKSSSTDRVYSISVTNGYFSDDYTFIVKKVDKNKESNEEASTNSSSEVSSSQSETSISTSSNMSNVKELKCPTINSTVDPNIWTNKDIGFTMNFNDSNANSYEWFTAQNVDSAHVNQFNWYLWESKDKKFDYVYSKYNGNLTKINTQNYKNTKKAIASYSACANNVCTQWLLGSGYRKINIRVYDANGKYIDCGGEKTYLIDKTIPVVNKVTKNDNKNNTYNVEVDSKGSYLQSEYIEYGNSQKNLNKKVRANRITNLNYDVLYFRVCTKIGNCSSVKKVNGILKCPEIKSSTKANVWTNNNITFNFKFGENVKKYEWYTNDSKGNFKNSGTITNLSQTRTIVGSGRRKIRLKIYDEKNNSKVCTYGDYLIDKVKPSAPNLVARANNNKGKIIRLNNNTSYKHKIYIEKLSTSKNTSEILKYQFRECGKNVIYNLNSSWGEFIVQQNNGFCRQFRVVDKAGNISAWSSPYYAKVRKAKVLVIAGHTYEPDCKKAISVSGGNNCRRTLIAKNGTKIKETTINRDLSKKLVNELKNFDIDVTYANAVLGETNTKNSKTLWSEIKLGNSNKYKQLKNKFKNYDYAIEIHMNAAGATSAGGRTKGANILYNTKNGPTNIDKAVAKSVMDIMGNGGKNIDTYNWEDQKFFRELNIPFTYLEAEFYTNESAILKFMSKENQIAHEMAKAIKKNLW